MRAEVKHLRRKDVDLEKVWDVESATGKGVLYVGHSKNETSKRKIPLNGAARDAITRMLQRADELGHTDPEHYLWCASQHHHYDPDQAGEEVRRRLAVAAGRSRPARLPVPRLAPHGRHGPARGR